MSARVSGWVWENAPVKSGDLVVLLALADNAHDDGTGAYPSQAHLARKARMTERQVRNCLKSLEEKELIRRQGSTAGGVVVWAVIMDGSPLPGGKEFPPAIDDTQGGKSTSDRTVPSEPSKPPASRARAKAKPDPDALPDGFPAALAEPLESVMRSLTFAAESRGVPLPARAAVARAMMKPERGRKPFAAVAERVEHWLVYGNGQRAQCRDVVARWRDWCDQEPDYRPVKQPIAAKAGGLAGGNVHPINGARPSRFDVAQAGLAEAHARLVAEGK